ncbi:hypothetical protein GCM10009526_22750 [Glutamicibacter creatinolyticus]
MESDALRGLRTDARKPTELVDQFLNCSLVHCCSLSLLGEPVLAGPGSRTRLASHTDTYPWRAAQLEAAAKFHRIAVGVTLFDHHAAQQPFDGRHPDQV